MARATRQFRIIGLLFSINGLLFSGPVLAQTATQTPPIQTPAPLIPPKPAATAAKPAVPFPADARVGYIDMQAIFAASNIGQQALVQLKALNDNLTAGLAARDKEMQGLSEKLRTQQGVVNPQVAAAWNLSLQKLQREAQFAQQEAQVTVSQMQEQMLSDFQARVRPVIDAIRTEKGLWIIFAIDNDNGGLSVASANPGVDLSDEVTKRLNAMK
jgi:Skp family chaperone for outer membrane proteins